MQDRLIAPSTITLLDDRLIRQVDEPEVLCSKRAIRLNGPAFITEADQQHDTRSAVRPMKDMHAIVLIAFGTQNT
jgi:hypothetical protein